jgi:hypothetical protein
MRDRSDADLVPSRISVDQTTEPMDIYPFVLTHEMGHFTQSLFSTLDSPGGDHAYTDHEDPLLAWIEGSASAIAALVLGTPHQNGITTIKEQLVVGIDDPSNDTIDGITQSWPLGWYQEATITRLAQHRLGIHRAARRDEPGQCLRHRRAHRCREHHIDGR